MGDIIIDHQQFEELLGKVDTIVGFIGIMDKNEAILETIASNGQ
jgi:hypothetical protein